jgi:hypothetical protein
MRQTLATPIRRSHAGLPKPHSLAIGKKQNRGEMLPFWRGRREGKGSCLGLALFLYQSGGMANDNSGKQDWQTFRKIYPTLTEQELNEADTNFSRYLEIALQIYQEQHSAAKDFDSSPASSTMKERSKFSLKN